MFRKSRFLALCLTAVLLALTYAVGTTPVRGDTQFLDKVLKEIGPRSGKWGKIAVDSSSSDRSYDLTLVYRTMPSGLQEVESDTKRIARAVLKTLIADGRKPRQEMISVNVSAHMPFRGETGAAMARVFGMTHYSYANDSLQFKPAN
jgi:hypothetical protein